VFCTRAKEQTSNMRTCAAYVFLLFLEVCALLWHFYRTLPLNFSLCDAPLSLSLSVLTLSQLLREGDLDDGAWARREDRDNDYRVKVAALARARTTIEKPENADRLSTMPSSGNDADAATISGTDSTVSFSVEKANATTAGTDESNVDVPTLAEPLDPNYDLVRAFENLSTNIPTQHTLKS
jgi:hypothetical protein